MEPLVEALTLRKCAMDEGIKEWIEALASKDHLTRLRCAERLRSMPLGALGPFFEVGLQDPRANVVAEVARLAGRLRAVATSQRLALIAADHRASVRARKAAATALGALGFEPGLAALATLIDHPNDMLRRATVEAAGRIGGAGALEILLEGASDAAWQVRMYAAIGLGSATEAEPAFVALDAALEVETHDATAEEMLRSMAELATRCAALSARAAARFVAALEDPDASPGGWVRARAAARGLGEVGAAEAIAALERVLTIDPPAQVAEQAQWALAQLESLDPLA